MMHHYEGDEIQGIPSEQEIAQVKAYAAELQSEIDALEKGGDSTHAVAMRSLLEEKPVMDAMTSLRSALPPLGLREEPFDKTLAASLERITKTKHEAEHTSENKFWRLRIALNKQLAKIAGMESKRNFYTYNNR